MPPRNLFIFILFFILFLPIYIIKAIDLFVETPKT